MDLVTVAVVFFMLCLFTYIIIKKLEKLDNKTDTVAFSDLASRMTEIKTKFEEGQKKQEELNKQRDELSKQNMQRFTDELNNINRLFAGTKNRGKIGENILKEVLTPFIKANKVVKDLNIDNKVVEFAWKVSQDKFIPLDSKLPEVLEIYKEYVKTESKDDQLRLKKKIFEKIKKRIEDAKKYRDKRNTTDKAIIAIPDAIYELIPEINSEASKTNIIVTGYHLVVYVASYIEREHLCIIESGDVGEYKKSIESILRLIEEIKDRAKTIDKGVIMIRNANDSIKEASNEAERNKPKTKKKIKNKLITD